MWLSNRKLLLSLLFITILGANFLILATDLTKLHGKVKNEDGKAISGAKILVEKAGKVITTTTTNDKGEFDLELELGDVISVEAQGYQSSKISTEPGKNKKLEVVLTRTITLIRGTVFTERGFSLPNALVVIELTSSDNKTDKFRKEYTTNQAGEFAFRLPNTGQYRLTASAKGYEADSKTIEINIGEARNTAFSLMPSKK